MKILFSYKKKGDFYRWYCSCGSKALKYSAMDRFAAHTKWRGHAKGVHGFTAEKPESLKRPRKHHGHLMPGEILAIRILRMSGMQTGEIAKQFYITDGAVSNITRGVSHKHSDGPIAGVDYSQFTWTEDEIRQIREMRQAGGSYGQIKRRWGVSGGHLHLILTGQSYKYAPGPIQGVDYKSFYGDLDDEVKV